ncbi:YecR family lipoprotein [Phocoenobacter skyensis]|uniref:YecR-like lipoprotein n=1 Tax=Phocoenobacter skyensis TaxID=97481 RepID=A0A1H8A1N7_9PAST|nr:YecR family lipoprotein [Pasteurella skyensis]MDP8184419.1 YecR family lipoprotein [Pasteurella skyensis]QLB22581.1 hypothetical protein A6B44_04925 [Pasteurella skyensis]SEM63748.1 YecR-like lipoprotein [Pasteurella skyensis]
MKKLLVVSLLSLVLTGCAVQEKEMYAVGGSKSDGIVEMAVTKQPFERVQVNKEKTLQTVIRKCKAWGYSNAEPFGGSTRGCNSMWGGDCMEYIMKVKYQCTNN